MLVEALEAEVASHLERHVDERDAHGHDPHRLPRGERCSTTRTGEYYHLPVAGVRAGDWADLSLDNSFSRADGGRVQHIMSLEEGSVVGAVAVGVGATLGMDLWNLFLKRAFGIPSLNYCLLGRWLSHMGRGTFRHVSISAAPPMPYECVAGWVAHYSVGLVFALAFVLTVPGWLSQPSVLPALLYGVGTVVFPFFVMQPSLGFGIAGSRTPSPTQARLKSVATHTVFGVGMYLSALVVNQVQHVLS